MVQLTINSGFAAPSHEWYHAMVLPNSSSLTVAFTVKW